MSTEHVGKCILIFSFPIICSLQATEGQRESQKSLSSTVGEFLNIGWAFLFHCSHVVGKIRRLVLSYRKYT